MASFQLLSLIFLLMCVCVFFLYVCMCYLYRFWWTPICTQKKLRRQGIKGFTYSFPHGNTKEIMKMMKECNGKPMNLISPHFIFPKVHPHIYSWLNIFGKNFVIWNGGRANLVVTEVDLVKEIMQRDDDFPKTEADWFIKKLLGDGVVTTKGEKWARHRKLANHAFNAESLKSMIPTMIASAEVFLERWKQQEREEIEVYEEFQLVTSEVISMSAFGSSYLEGKEIFEMITKMAILFSRNKVRLPGLRFIKSKDEIEADKLEEGIQKSILRIMEKRKRESTANGETESYGTDFLGLLMKAQNDADEKKRLSAQEVIDECKTFYVAGQETTATTLAWMAFLLGFHTQWQDKAREEVFKIFGKGNPTADGLSKLKLMNMIIHETLRLYPVVHEFPRQVKEETRLGNFILPANMNVFIPNLALHHDAEIWGDDTHLFNPERFSQGVAKATNNNLAAYLPFGMGPRTCIGFNYSITEAKILMSMILQRYSFTLSPAYIHSPKQILTVSPLHGVQIKLQPLTD